MTLRGMLLWMKRLLGGAQAEPPATTNQAPSESAPAEDDAPPTESTPEPTPEPELDKDSRESIEATMRARLSAEDADAVIETLARTVHLDVEAADTVELGRSRLGGAPDLAPGIAWPSWTPSDDVADFVDRDRGDGPVPLQFLAQLDLEQLAEHAEVTGLPTTGWLWFFYDAEIVPWGEPAHRPASRVVYSTCARDELVRTEAPAVIAEHGFPLCAATPRVGWTFVPDVCEDYDAADTLLDKVRGYPPLHRIAGPADAVQDDPAEECKTYQRHEDARDGSDAPPSSSADWTLLLQLDSDDGALDWMWGDLGTLYFMIERDRLARADCGNVMCLMQCS